MTTQEKYRALRRDDPLMDAQTALRIAKAPDPTKDWEAAGPDETYKREVDGFTVTLKIESESIYPREDDGLGHYVDEVRHWQEYVPDWEGEYPPPAETLPLGLPYTAFRYHGPGWVQSEGTGYFMPDGIDDQFDYYRRMGQSKSVAWDLTKAWVEALIADFFTAPLTYTDLVVTVSKKGIDLGTSVFGTSYIDKPGPYGRDYLFTATDEYGMVDEALDEAREAIEMLTAEA